MFLVDAPVSDSQVGTATLETDGILRFEGLRILRN
jgi:hypothetical protein